MNKPMNYHGFAWQDITEAYNDEYLKTPEGLEDTIKHNKRCKKLQKHYKKHGWDPSETWNLDVTIAHFILPRLKYLRKNTHGYPANLTEKSWDKILKQMIKAFKLITSDDDFTVHSTKKLDKGLQLFAKYYRGLWD